MRDTQVLFPNFKEGGEFMWTLLAQSIIGIGRGTGGQEAIK